MINDLSCLNNFNDVSFACFKNLYEQIGYPKVFSYNLDNKLNKQLWQVLE